MAILGTFAIPLIPGPGPPSRRHGGHEPVQILFQDSWIHAWRMIHIAARETRHPQYDRHRMQHTPNGPRSKLVVMLVATSEEQVLSFIPVSPARQRIKV